MSRLSLLKVAGLILGQLTMLLYGKRNCRVHISPNSLHLNESNVNKSESKWEQHYSHFVNDKNTGESVRKYSKNVFIRFDGHGWGHVLSDEGGA